MLFSIVLPCFNVAKYVKKCIKSILENCMDGVELIYVDDCSIDNTADVIRSCMMESGKNVKYKIINQPTKVFLPRVIGEC